MRFFRVKEGIQFIYFDHKRIKEGKVFVIREKKYFCRKDKVDKVMTVDEQISRITMEEVKTNESAKPQVNTNWQEREETRIAMADAAAEAEIAAENSVRQAREEEETAAIKAVEGGTAPVNVTTEAPAEEVTTAGEGQGEGAPQGNLTEEVV